MTRGRRPNLALEPSRQLLTQRAFRERKAAHLRSLEEAVARLEAENAALKAAREGGREEGKEPPGSGAESSSSASASGSGTRKSGKSGSSATAPSSTEAPEEWGPQQQQKERGGEREHKEHQQQQQASRPFCEGCWTARRNTEEIHTAMSTVDFHLATLASAMTQLRGALGRGDTSRLHGAVDESMAGAASAPLWSPLPALRAPLPSAMTGGAAAGVGVAAPQQQEQLVETLKRWGPAPALPSPRGGGGSPPALAGPSRTHSSSSSSTSHVRGEASLHHHHPYARPSSHAPVGRASMLLASTRSAGVSPSHSHSYSHHAGAYDVPSPATSDYGGAGGSTTPRETRRARSPSAQSAQSAYAGSPRAAAAPPTQQQQQGYHQPGTPGGYASWSGAAALHAPPPVQQHFARGAEDERMLPLPLPLPHASSSSPHAYPAGAGAGAGMLPPPATAPAAPKKGGCCGVPLEQSPCHPSPLPPPPHTASHASPPLELPPPTGAGAGAFALQHAPALPPLAAASPPPPQQQQQQAQQQAGVQLQDAECCYGLFKCDKDGAIIA